MSQASLESQIVPDRSPLMTRRSLLLGLGAWSVSQLLAGCASQASQPLRVYLLRDSVPAQLLNEFRKSAQKAGTSVRLTLSPKTQVQDLFSLLQTWKQDGGEVPSESWFGWVPGWVPLIGNQDPTQVDWVSLGDYWLSVAIKQGLVQPVDLNQFAERSLLEQNPVLKKLVIRNAQGLPDSQGQVWAVPYRLGSTVIAYRKDLLEEHKIAPPTDWSDLWRPELRGRISLLDQPREVIGLVLKKLGKSYNTADLNAVPGLKDELRSLQQQVKFYSSTNYLQPLILDDTWVAVGWSTDVLSAMQTDPKIAAVVPKSGTALWADLWVRPAGSPAQLSPASVNWLNFYWQPETAKLLSQLSLAIAPRLLSTPRNQLPESLKNNLVLLPSPDSFQASEFLDPLSASSAQQYQAIWESLRKAA